MSEVYDACVVDVNELKSKRKILNKLINEAIRNNKNDALDTLTKLYALLYSSYAEISFLKLIHTPDGFSNEEIRVILKETNLTEKWHKCFELAMKKISNEDNKGEIANKRKKLQNILREYIIQPSKIRNKIAHGQWKKCLNSENEKINQEITSAILELDCVKIDILFSVYDMFQQCIVDLIKSPRTHYRDYYSQIVKLEAFVEKTKMWSLGSKRKILQNSLKYRKYKEKTQCQSNFTI